MPRRRFASSFWRVNSPLSDHPRSLAQRTACHILRPMIERPVISAAPKVLLHDHLDGGLRPQTVIELARDNGYDRLPTWDAGELAQSFKAGAERKSLVLYLEGFEHTVGVMQTRDALTRGALGCPEALAAAGVFYAE